MKPKTFKNHTPDTEVEYLSCIYCGRVFEHQEVFTAFVNETDFIVVAECLKCSDYYGSCDYPEREGTGWLVLERNLDHYECYDVDDLDLL